MQLYLNNTSPFSRVVVATAFTTGQALELHWVDPWADTAPFTSTNPFGTIPFLATDKGGLVESLSICEYLIDRAKEPSITLANTQFQDKQNLAFAKTLMEIAFRSAALSRFSDTPHGWSQKGNQGLVRALSCLETELKRNWNGQAETLANLYLHIALDYIAFRHNELMPTLEGTNIGHFIAQSAFASLLDKISLEWLSTKPQRLSPHE